MEGVYDGDSVGEVSSASWTNNDVLGMCISASIAC